MPFDGVVTKSVVKELSELLIGSRIVKIFQPEADEIILNIRAKGQNYKLLLSASANYPRIHITEAIKDNPAAPPMFCMVLRKHLSGGKFVNIKFHDFERIITLQIESTNELGDLTLKNLIIEIMGRHSNIILVNSEDKIIDSIKHVDAEVSSVREVMPARPYVFPPAQEKLNPENINIDQFFNNLSESQGISIEKYILNHIRGFSPLLCREICFRAGIDSKTTVSGLLPHTLDALSKALEEISKAILLNNFSPCILYRETQDNPEDFHCIEITQFRSTSCFSSISQVIDTYYREKDNSERLKQKKAGLLKVIGNNLDRCNKKLALQQDKLREVADRDKLKLFGELITANIYAIPRKSKSVSLQNYYTENNDYVEIPMDENLLPQENAQRFFKRYGKAKSAFEYTTQQLEENLKEIEYLESVLHQLESCTLVQEIDEIRQELVEQSYLSVRRKGTSKKKEIQSKPLHFKSSDGLDVFVGKNNRQNDLLTLKLSSSNDIWLHTRNIPGSHVIIRKLQHDIPDSTLLEAAILAAYHSKAKHSSTIPVDYTTVRNVKKPNGAKPGMVIYENFKTLIVTPNEEVVEKLKVEK